MNRVKNVWNLFKLDWQRIFKNPLAFLLIIALIIIPSLYAWFNIAALWDPYSKTGDLKVAVYSDDRPATFKGTKVEIGKELTKSLKTNDKMGWTFVSSKKDLDEGVKSGKYYAGIYIPKDFSKDILSFVEGDIKKPTLDYTVNQKINAIAPKITGTGASTIQSTISSEFISTVSKTVVKTFNEIGYDLDTNLPTINKVTSLILKLDENMPEINQYTQEVLDLQKKMPEIKEKINKANEFTDYIPEANRLAQKVIKVNQNIGEIDKLGSVVEQVQGKIPEIERAGVQLAMIDQDFSGIAATIVDAADEGEQAVQILQQARKSLPDVTTLISHTDTAIKEAQKAVPTIKNALTTVGNAVNTAADVLKTVGGNLRQTYNQLADFVEATHTITDADRQTIKDVTVTQQKHVENLISITASLKENLQSIKNITGSSDLDQNIAQLETIQGQLTTVQNDLSQLTTGIDQMDEATLKNTLKTLRSHENELLNNIDQLPFNNITQAVNTLLTQLQTDLGTAQGIINNAQTILPKLDPLFDKAIGTINSAVGYVHKYQAELPAVQKEIHDANTILNGNMTTITGGINTASNLYQNEFPTLKTKLGNVASFMENDLPGVENDITKTLKLVNEKMPSVDTAINDASDIINSDWPSLQKGIQNSAKKIRDQKDDIDLHEVIALLKKDANKESDFIANPIDLSEKDIFPVPNYGSASAPFYTALCLWVGGLLFSSIAVTQFSLSEEDKKKYTSKQTYMARLFTFLVVGFFQALIVSLGNMWLLGTYVKQPVWFVLFTLLLGIIFTTIIYTLVALLGNVGKGAAIILLVLSISGAGGNFPIELSGKFFQFINPLLPFTYAVNVLREAVGGIYWPNTIRDLIVLIGFGLVFTLIGVFLKGYLEPFFNKIHDKVQESKIIH